MSSTIDERIVQMQFDNKQFESGIQTSLKSLDRLKNGLDLEGSAKSLKNLEKAGRSFSLANVASSVESVASRFSNLGIVGMTALQRITNSAITAGTQLVKSLTLDPVSMGFSEYETKMNAITTILTNTQDKGTTLDDVNATLQELNEYADQTIYNFAEMTRNIGTFTAAGVDLETSAKAIKGIANLAAGSGSNAQQASTAMYQLSQALAAGRVSLQDWNSVVNAGMGGQLFQNALKETAKQMGIVVDESVSFRESISGTGGRESWLTSDVLIKTLEKFAEDDTLVKAATEVKTFTQLMDTMKESVQSGWATSWEYIIGDREQATKVLTAISDGFNELIGPSTEARNATLKFWNENGGRAAIIEGLASAFSTLKSVMKPIGDAFGEVFPPVSGERLVEISQKFKDLMSNFKISDKTAENLKRTFKGLFSVIDIGRQALFAVGTAFGRVVGFVAPAGDGILGITAAIGDFATRLNETIKEGDLFNKMLSGIGKVISPIANGVKSLVGAIGGGLGNLTTDGLSGLSSFLSSVSENFSPLQTLGKIVDSVFGGMATLFEGAMPIFSNFGTIVSNCFSKIFGAISNSDPEALSTVFSLGALTTITIGIKKFTDSLTSVTDGLGDVFGSFNGIFESINGVFNGLGDTMKAYQTSLKSGVFLKVAASIAILSGSMFLLSKIDSNKLAGSVAAITALIGELYGSMILMDKISMGTGFRGVAKISTAMLALSVSVLILSSALKKISGMDWDSLVRGLTGIGALSAILVASANGLSKSSGKLIKGSAGLLVFAASIRILVGAVEKLGALDAQDLAKGLIGVGVLCTELAIFLKATNFNGLGLKSGTGLVMLAASISILASAVSKFSEISVGGLAKGLSAIAIILTQIGLFSKLTGGTKGLTGTAIGMTVLGGAMLIFGKAVGQLGNLSVEQIVKGLAAMAGVLTEITLAMAFMPTGMFGNAIALVAVSGVISILADALMTMTSISWGGIAKSLIALAGALTAVVVAVNLMTGALSGAAALLAVSAAIRIFTPAILALSKLSLGEIGIALLALAGSLAVLGVAAIALAPVTPALLALAGAVALFGAAALAVGVGVSAFAAGLAALAVSGTAGAAALVAIVSTLLSMIPMLLTQIGNGIIAFAKVIAEGAPAIGQAIIAVGKEVIAMIVELAPDIAEAAVTLLAAFLETIADHLPDIINSGVDIILSFLKGISDNIGEMAAAGVEVVVSFLDAVAAQTPVIIDGAFNFVITFVDAIGEGIEENTPKLVEAMAGLAGNMASGLIKGIGSGVKAVGKGVIDLGKSAVNGVKDFLGINSPSKVFAELGKFTSIGFANGIIDNAKSANIAAGNLGSGVVKSLKDVLAIRSPSKVTRDEVGRYVVQGIAEGITSDMSAEEAAAQKAKNIVDAFQTEFDKFDLDAETSDLEYQLWEKLNGATASEAEKSAANMNLMTNKLQIQAEKVRLYQAQYQTTLDNVGAQAEETQDAYNRLLEAQIDLVDLSNQLNEARSTEAARNREAFNRYNEYLNQYQDLLLEQGFTMEQIKAAAAEESGYNVNSMTMNMNADVQEAVSSAMNAVETTYAENAQATFGSLTSNFATWGVTYANALSTGIQNGATQVTTNTQTMVNTCVSTIRAGQPSWIEGATYLVDGFIIGIRQNVDRAAQEAAAMASAAYSAAMAALGVHSPSTKFAELGMYADLGLAKGFKDYSDVAERESEETANRTVSGFSTVIGRISDAINGDIDLTPTIRPVVDMDDVRRSGSEIGTVLGEYSGLRLGASLNRVRFTSSVSKRDSGSDASTNPESRGNTYNYLTQNNYSPKALSRTEIYRQTKNLYSRIKGR